MFICKKLETVEKVVTTSNKLETTKHFSFDRKDRYEKLVNSVGLGNPLITFSVDKGHRNGSEVHSVTDTGLVFISNEASQRLITVEALRPGQLYRYIVTSGIEKPSWFNRVMLVCKSNTEKGYNYL